MHDDMIDKKHEYIEDTAKAVRGLLGDAMDKINLALSNLHYIEAMAGEKMTCDDCGAYDTCNYAYNPYNTNGDCLNK